MKKIFFVILSAGLMLSACKKDKEMPTNSVFNPHDDKAVEARIKSFNQSLQQKQGEPMTVSDATWDIEAALNYNYCHVELPQGNTCEDSIIVEIPLNNGKLDFCNVENAYQQAEIKLQSLLKKGTYHAIVVDVKPLQISDVFKAKLTFVVGDGVVKKSVTYPNDFGLSDYWRWSWNLGKCDGAYTPDDARSLLAYWLNSGMSYIPGQYFTDIAEVTAKVDPFSNTFKNTNDQTPNDNYLDYKIFINSRQGINANGNLVNQSNFVNEYYPGPCITPNEMNFYKWSMRDIAINYSNNGGIRPLGKSIVNFSITSFIQIYSPDILYWSEHVLRINYGILHVGQQN